MPRPTARPRLEPLEDRTTPAAGELDTTFGTDGRVTVPFDLAAGGNDEARAVALQPDGKMVLVGTALPGATGIATDIAVARLTTDGQLDTTFDGDGRKTIALDLVPSGSDQASAVAVQSDGKILIAGTVQTVAGTSGDQDQMVLIRLNPDGSLDTTFDGDGMRVVAPDHGGGASAVLVQPDGKIVLAGTAWPTTNNESYFAVLRFNTDGSPDTTFGTAGVYRGGFHGTAYGATLDSAGRILVTGWGDGLGGGRIDFAAVRLTSTGAADTTFDDDGAAFVAFDTGGAMEDYATTVLVQPDGKVVLAGSSEQAYGTYLMYAFAAARLNADGTPDGTFGTGGKVTVPFAPSGSSSSARAAALQSDGKILLAGTASTNLPDFDLAAARLTAAGALDPTFDGDGLAVAGFNRGGNNIDEGFGAALQPDGRLVVAGYAQGDATGEDFAVARLTADPANNPPTANPDTLTVNEGAAATAVDVLANDSTAPDTGETLTVTAVTQPAHGTVTLAGGVVRYAPAAGFHGADWFTYTLSDGNGGTAAGTVFVAVAPAGGLPAPAVAFAPTGFDTPGNAMAVAAGDFDGDGKPDAVVGSSGGITTFRGDGAGGLAAPTTAGTGSSFPHAVRVADLTGDGKPDVIVGNDSGQSLSVFVGNGDGTFQAPVVVAVGGANLQGLAVADFDRDGKLDVAVVEDDRLAVLRYVGGAGLLGTPTFFGAGTGGTALDAADLDGDGNPDLVAADMAHDRLVVFLGTGTGSFGPAVFLAAGAGSQPYGVIATDWTGRPLDLNGDGKTDLAAAFNGTGTVGVFLGDGTGRFTAPLTSATGSPRAGRLTAADLDADGFLDLAVTVSGGLSPGPQAVLAGDGTGRFAAADAPTVGMSDVTAADLNGDGLPDLLGTLPFSPGTVVAAVNTTPVVASFQVSAPAAVTTGVPFTVTVTATDAGGATLAGYKGAVHFTSSDPAAVLPADVRFDPADGGVETFTVTLAATGSQTVGVGDRVRTGATGTAAVGVFRVNHAPTAADDTLTLDEDTAAAADVLGNDSAAPDAGETPTVTAVTQPAHGAVTLVGGLVTYTPAADFNGADSFTYTISDGFAGPGGPGTATATVRVTVTPVNDPPTAADDTLTVTEDDPATAVVVLANDSFAPDAGETLTVTAVTQPAHGTVTLSGGVVRYAPAANYNGSDSFTYTISDGSGGTATATVTVTVTPVNDPPTARADVFTVAAGAAATLPVLANDSADPDAGEALAVLSVAQPAAGGTTAVAPGGAGVVFTPAAGFAGTVTFTYTVSDGNGGTADATVAATVTAAAGVGPVRPVAVGGAADGTVRLTSASGTTTVAPFGPLAVAVRTASADVDGDGIADVVAVTGPGTPLRVAVLSGATGRVLLQAFDPFGGDFPGGGYVAAADLDGDGRAEFAVTPDQGGGPRVTVFSLDPSGLRRQRANFFGIDDPNFRGGARAALGDVNGDGTPDVVVAAGFGGGPRTAIFTGQSVLAGAPERLVADFFAFPGSDAQNLRNGSFVAAGDVDGDGNADLVFGGGPGGAPRVFILSGALVSGGDLDAAYSRPVANFFVGGDLNDRGGARVAVTNADGDTRADVAVGSGDGDPARVRVYAGKDFAGGGEPAHQDLNPLGGAVLTDGVFVG